MNMKRECLGLVIGVAATLVLALPGPAGAAPMTFTVYDEPDVEIDVSFAYAAVDASNATITVWLDNLSAHPEARITGLGFNAPDGALDEVDPPQGAPFLVYTPDQSGDGSGFVGMVHYSNGAGGGIAADGYGHFDMAAFNGPDGDLNDGTSLIGIQDSGTFVFTVTGSGLDVLDEMSFLSLYSAPPSDGNGVQTFVVRWQDLDSGSGFAVIPEPVTLPLLTLAGLTLLRRRRR
jgi:hypothetical protein